MSMSVTTAPPVPQASRRASGSSFYSAMRILPRSQRNAMFEIYSFCRQVDDVADSDRPRPERIADLKRWRGDIEALYAGAPPPHLAGLLTPTRAFKLRKDDFLAVIDGMEMDAKADIRAPDLVTLDLYCDRVASAVGRLSVRVFGMGEQEGLRLAHHLGRALQLTNILRDLDEDAGIGRLYLPREALAEAGISGDDPHTVLASPYLGKACAAIVDRIRSHFDEAGKIIAAAPPRTVRAPKIMAEVYGLILAGLRKRGWSPPRQRVRVSRWRVLKIALSHLFGRR
jgi:presqualene diphosphate synthase